MSLGNIEGLGSFRGMSRKAVISIMKDVGPANPALNWDDLQWLYELWNGPLLVKGITNGEGEHNGADYT